jgi:group I intron endonuclease
MAKAGIYIIYNHLSSKVYVGQSVDTGQRIRRHKCQLRAGRHFNLHLQSAWDKYGEDAFEFKVVQEISCDNQETLVGELNRLEQDLIRQMNAFGSGGYNLDSGGMNKIFSEESRAKMRKSHLGQKPYPWTDAMRQRSREANLGKILSPETRQKISKALIGYPAWNKGKRYKTHPCSEERKRKIGLAQVGSKNHNFGKTTPEAVKEKIRISNNGSKCYLAKLDETKVADIKRRLAAGESGRSLATEYGVAPTQISCIRLGKTWKHVAI